MTSNPHSPDAEILFGGPRYATTTPDRRTSYRDSSTHRSWLPPSWTTSDDRVRGGASYSSLSALPNNHALFRGHLDIKTLGGAGFASQFRSALPQDKDDLAKVEQKNSANGSGWDLSAYEGLEIDIESGDEKIYTVVLRDEEQLPKRGDGRERAGVNWEGEFRVGRPGEKGWIPWSAFRATYRGKEKEGVGRLKTGEIRRMGLMMRRLVAVRFQADGMQQVDENQSQFGMQEGDFRLEMRSISARKEKSEGGTGIAP